MEGLVLFILFLAILAVILYPVWRRYYSTAFTTTTLTTPIVGTKCFPSTTFPVKGGLIDLRNCTDDVYILGTKSKVHFIQEI